MIKVYDVGFLITIVEGPKIYGYGGMDVMARWWCMFLLKRMGFDQLPQSFASFSDILSLIYFNFQNISTLINSDINAASFLWNIIWYHCTYIDEEYPSYMQHGALPNLQIPTVF